MRRRGRERWMMGRGGRDKLEKLVKIQKIAVIYDTKLLHTKAFGIEKSIFVLTHTAIARCIIMCSKHTYVCMYL